MTARASILALATLLVACAHQPPALPPAPSGLQRLAIAAPINRTGDDLVEQPGVFERLLRERPTTVSGILAEDLRARLEEQGFRIVTGTADVPVLRTEVRRWDVYGADYSMVTVDVDAALVESGGRTLWSASRTGWHVPTAAADSRVEASTIASAAIVEALLGGWEPVGR